MPLKKVRNIGRSLAISTLCGCAVVFAQGQDGSSSKQTAPPAGTPKTVVGCLTGYDGHYTLGASNDTLYLLDGDTALFKRYNAKLVRATGTVSESAPGTSRNNVLSQQPPVMMVTALKKVADGCN
jgi:hypothetical protein